MSFDYLSAEYLGMLKDTNECIKYLMAHIRGLETSMNDLRVELKEKDEKLMYYMSKDSFSISRAELSSFFAVVKNRRETDKEWDLFQETFHSKVQIQIYAWIDALPQG